MKKEKKEELMIFLEKIGINNSKVLERIVSLTKKGPGVSIAKAIEIIADAKKEIDINSEEYQLLLASQTLSREIERIDNL